MWFVCCKRPSSVRGHGRGLGPVRPHGLAQARRAHGLAKISLFSNAQKIQQSDNYHLTVMFYLHRKFNIYLGDGVNLIIIQSKIAWL